MKWYTLKVATGKERKVKELIEKEIKNHGMEEYYSQVLIPKEKVYKVKDGKRISQERSYLPGYLLIEIDLMGEISHLIKRVNGVSGFLGGDNPEPLKEKEIKRILGKMDELEASDEIIEDVYNEGEKVRITEGPFTNFNGTVTNVDDVKKRITVAVKIFNRITPVELAFNQIDRKF